MCVYKKLKMYKCDGFKYYHRFGHPEKKDYRIKTEYKRIEYLSYNTELQLASEVTDTKYTVYQFK